MCSSQFSLGLLAFCLGLVGSGFTAPVGSPNPCDSPEDSRTFETIVAPLLVEKCLGCHGGATIEGGYSVADTDLLFRAGDSGAMPVSVNQLESSELLVRLSANDPIIRMPFEAEPLSDSEITSVRRWIESGVNSDCPRKRHRSRRSMANRSRAQELLCTTKVLFRFRPFS